MQCPRKESKENPLAADVSGMKPFKDDGRIHVVKAITGGIQVGPQYIKISFVTKSLSLKIDHVAGSPQSV